MIVIFLHALSLATTPLLSFGPFKIFVLSQALQQGRRQALTLAFTPLVADIPVILLVWLVLRQLPAAAIDLLRIGGGLFFFYLATGLLRRGRRRGLTAAAVAQAPRRTFWQAVTAIWISPQVYANWAAIGIPALLSYAALSFWHGVAFLVFFYVLWIGGLALQILIFSQAGQIDERANGYLIMLGGLLLLGFGCYQIWLGVTGLIT